MIRQVKPNSYDPLDSCGKSVKKRLYALVYILDGFADVYRVASYAEEYGPNRKAIRVASGTIEECQSVAFGIADSGHCVRTFYCPEFTSNSQIHRWHSDLSSMRFDSRINPINIGDPANAE